MKIRQLMLVAAAGLACFSAYANDVPSKPLSMVVIIGNLEKQGYTAIHEIKFKDNVYHVEGIDKQGKEIKSNVNPETGVVTESEKSAVTLTILDAVKKVEAAGYHSIYAIESDDDKYEVKALDKEDKKVSLDVNGKTGEISKDIF